MQSMQLALDIHGFGPCYHSEGDFQSLDFHSVSTVLGVPSVCAYSRHVDQSTTRLDILTTRFFQRTCYDLSDYEQFVEVASTLDIIQCPPFPSPAFLMWPVFKVLSNHRETHPHVNKDTPSRSKGLFVHHVGDGSHANAPAKARMAILSLQKMHRGLICRHTGRDTVHVQ